MPSTDHSKKRGAPMHERVSISGEEFNNVFNKARLKANKEFLKSDSINGVGNNLTTDLKIKQELKILDYIVKESRGIIQGLEKYKGAEVQYKNALSVEFGIAENTITNPGDTLGKIINLFKESTTEPVSLDKTYWEKIKNYAEKQDNDLSVNDPSSSQLTDDAKLFFGRHPYWKVFYYHINSAEVHGVAMAKLHVLDNGVVEIENARVDTTEKDYVGTFRQLEKDKCLAFELKVKEYESENLQMLIAYEFLETTTIMEGVYQNIFDNSKFVAGSIVLYRMTEAEAQNVQPAFFANGDGIEAQTIRKFFRHQYQNYIEIPGRHFQLSQMDDFVDEHEQEEIVLVPIPQIYDYFISAPASFADEDVYQQIRTTVLKLKERILAIESSSAVYAPCEKFEEIQEYSSNDENWWRLNVYTPLLQSRILIIIYHPELERKRDLIPRQSGILFEFGIAFEAKKKCIFLAEKDMKVPNFVQNIIQTGQVHLKKGAFSDIGIHDRDFTDEEKLKLQEVLKFD